MSKMESQSGRDEMKPANRDEKPAGVVVEFRPPVANTGRLPRATALPDDPEDNGDDPGPAAA